MTINRLTTEWEEILFPLINLSDKLILTGTTSLYIMDLFTRDMLEHKRTQPKVIGDLDFSLSHDLLPNELIHIKDFLGVSEISEDTPEYEFNEKGDILGVLKNEKGEGIMKKFDPETILKKDIIQFNKLDEYGSSIFKVDIFNKHFISDNNTLLVPYYDGITLKIQHPALTWAHKARLAFDYRVGASLKHKNDINQFMNIQTEYEAKMHHLFIQSNKLKQKNSPDKGSQNNFSIFNL
jgi:hypothetical protein